ncbi:MAG: hypothetical protein HUJ56_11170 [Erysipelotrichaceae bacterium]|nr:hypothetical protein [Erysipelotrichaceae bacterium]
MENNGNDKNNELLKFAVATGAFVTVAAVASASGLLTGVTITGLVKLMTKAIKK